MKKEGMGKSGALHLEIQQVHHCMPKVKKKNLKIKIQFGYQLISFSVEKKFSEENRFKNKSGVGGIVG